MDHKKLLSYIQPVIELAEDDLALLLSCVTNRKLKKGEALLAYGEVCRAFYLVEEGHLRSYYNKDGVAINMNFTFEGEFTANLKSYRDRLPSELIIEAGEPASVWIFALREIAGKQEAHPEVARLVQRLAIGQLLASEAHSELFKIYSPAERYLYIEKNNPRLLQRISLSQLSSYLGVTRETLSRIRKKNN